MVIRGKILCRETNVCINLLYTINILLHYHSYLEVQLPGLGVAKLSIILNLEYERADINLHLTYS